MRFLNRTYPFVFLLMLMVFSFCKKKDDPEPPATEEPAPNPVNSADTGIYACKKIPAPPGPFGWTDSTVDVNKNVNFFMRNPLNGDEMIVVVDGDLFGYNKMFNINLKTKQQKFLANIDDFTPDVNARGWILFSTYEDNIYRIKTNGDSLTTVSKINVAHNPHWDYTGDNMYFFQKAYANVPAQLVKANRFGQTITALPHTMAHHAPFKKSDKVIRQKITDNIVTLVLRNMVDYSEKDLISGPYKGSSAPAHFSNLCLDQNDQNIYWSNASGIFRCNLLSLKTDTLFKNCDNRIYMRPKMVLNTGEMTYSLLLKRIINEQILFHEYKTFEYDIPSRQSRELKIF